VAPPVARLDLLLRRVGQRVLRQQLVDGAVEAFRRGAVVAQDVDHQGVVEQTWRLRRPDTTAIKAR